MRRFAFVCHFGANTETDFCGGGGGGDDIAVVVSGTGTKGFADGSQHIACFDWPNGVCVPNQSVAGLADTYSIALVCADSSNHRIRRIDLWGEQWVATFAGSGKPDVKDGSCESAEFFYPHSIAPDPIKSGCYFIADSYTIRYCDGKLYRRLRVVMITALRMAWAVRLNFITLKVWRVRPTRKRFL